MHRQLCELIVMEGFLSNPNDVAVEKVQVAALQPQYGCKPQFSFDPMASCPNLLPPHSCFLVKGWTRTVCLTTVLLCGYEHEDFWKAWYNDQLVMQL